MITRIIRFSITNRVFVLLAALVLAIWGTWAVKNTPVDALPDLSNVQVIVRTNFPGQAPQIVENQVTYPLTTTMLSVPGVKAVRGYSFFGDSFVYVIFDELMCAEKTGGFNLVNYRHSSGVYHEQETEDLHRRI